MEREHITQEYEKVEEAAVTSEATELDENICSDVRQAEDSSEKKRHRVSIVDYTLGEELVSAISHGIGALLSIAGLALCIIRAAGHGDAWAVTAGSIFGASLIILYTMSTLYHAFKPNKAKRVFRVLDHCSVFLLIAGTYTPYTLVTLRGWVGWTLFGVIWGLAILGIVLNSVNVDKFQKISTICNIAMGWAIIIAFKPLYDALAGGGIVLLLAGGAAYTVGAVLYAKGDKIRYMHSVWHFFVLAGSILHFLSVYYYVI